MAPYTFQIRQGGQSKPSVTTPCPDDDAARKEAAGMLADRVRDITGDLENNPEWQIEVTDESAKLIFRLSLLAELMK